MKSMFFRNWMTAGLVAAVSFGLTACNDDGGTPPPTTDATVVEGSYSGRMRIAEAAPAADDGGETPAGTSVEATVTENAVEFADFPIRDLVVKIVGEEAADAIVEAVGKVDYAIPYTAAINEEKSAVTMTLTPEPMKLSFVPDGGTDTEKENGDETSEIEVIVTVAADAEGIYTVETETLSFPLSVEEVTVGGQKLEGFESFSLNFDLAKLAASQN